MLAKQTIIEKLEQIADIKTGGTIVANKRISEIIMDGANIKLVLNLPTKDRAAKNRVEDQCREALRKVEGIREVMIITEGADTLETAAGSSGAAGASEKNRNPFDMQAPIPGVKNIIAVASGKGGVGKSTVCVNLALALQKKGMKVGLMDADIYGPSLGVLLGIDSKPKPGTVKEIAPIVKDGIKIMSLAFLTDSGTPVIWRGPIVMGVVKKFLCDVEWGELDYLLIDLPPGTGDAQLTLVQTVPLTAAVIVTTPSKLALVDAEKGLRMFVQLKVPVLGIIENMSGFICPHCGKATDVFDSGGGRAISSRLDAAFLGEIPLDAGVRSSGDGGKPIVAADASSPIAEAFFGLADNVIENCPVHRN